eukprot:TRINITY_DN5559_c0_g1_i1.p1 TRINITY_DN5559_c0_g1~~TRINITY_DN5559_c0_g1_i1.p1  ORF type:complete len:808 (+),score=158.12 TRINITY_DN5559_c0_g1_i1:56-2479(+)
MTVGGRTYDLQWTKTGRKRPSTVLNRRRQFEPTTVLYDVPSRPLSSCKRRSRAVAAVTEQEDPATRTRDSPKHVPNPPATSKSSVKRVVEQPNNADTEVDEAYTDSQNARAAIWLSVSKVQELVDGIEMTAKAHNLEDNGDPIPPEEEQVQHILPPSNISPQQQHSSVFDILEKPPPHTSDTILNSFDDIDDDITFEPDAVIPTERSTSELYKMLHSLSSHLGTLYRCCKGFVKRGIISYDHDYSEACVSALSTLKQVWGKFTDIVNTVNNKAEELTQVNHKLLLVQERQRGVEVSGQEHRLNHFVFRAMFRWQKRILWRQRIAAAGIAPTPDEIDPPQRKHSRIMKIRRQSRAQGTCGPLSPGTTSIIVSIEHMEALSKINNKVLDLWKEYVTRSCDTSEGVFLASQGDGCAIDKGYALIFAESSQTALRFSMQLQYGSSYVHWPKDIVESSYCPTKFESDVDKNSLYHQQVLFHKDDVESVDFEGTEIKKLESLAASIGIEEEELISHGGNVPYHLPKGEGSIMTYGPRMRISLHDGAVLQDESGYYGRGLMMASLLASKCVPGFVVISSSVRESLSKIIESDGLFVVPHPLSPITDFSSYNWREAGHQISYDFVPNGDTFYAVLPTELVCRAAIVDPVDDIYLHERLLYNPHWWMRFCNYPPDVWNTFESEDAPPPSPPPPPSQQQSTIKPVKKPRFPIQRYERCLMESDDQLSRLSALFTRMKNALTKHNPIKEFLDGGTPDSEFESLITKIVQCSSDSQLNDSVSLRADDDDDDDDEGREELVQTLNEYRLDAVLPPSANSD